LKIQQEDELYD